MALELLAPAKNADQGILALRCGADAVYMGGARFGARQAAGNGPEAFAQLTREARLWGARVYATLNTILFDGELEAARRQAWELHDAGVDAFIIQDMAYLDLDLPDLPLHASTQAACDGPEKVAFLAGAGFSRAILARELDLEAIRAIRAAADLELEAFVYGALCVGESGRCYLSGAVCGRSGNRGECAQPCRAPWNLVDAGGRVLVRDKHLLSIRDLDLSDHLEAMADAGVRSFKVEGRLKDADYVKNVVAYLRGKLDALLERRPELGRASLGRASLGRAPLGRAPLGRAALGRAAQGSAAQAFLPDPRKTFQRGLCTYRLEGRRQPMGTPDAARHLGEFVGQVRSVQGDRLVLDPAVELHPGDGLAFVDGAGVAGTVVNAVAARQVFVQDPARIRPGTRLHRNLDLHWLKALRAAKVERRIPVAARLDFPDGSVRLRLEDPSGLAAEARATGLFEPSREAGATVPAIRDALGRLGGTPFALGDLQVAEPRFVPASCLNALRREAAAALEARRREPRPRERRRPPAAALPPLPVTDLDFTWNVANRAARAFYERAGGRVLEPAAELQADLAGRVVMTTRHCLKYELGWCPVHRNPEPWRRLPEPREPLFLENGPTRLECRFDCRRCRMELVLGRRGEPG